MGSADEAPSRPASSAGPPRPPSVDTLARALADEVDLPHPLLVDAARRGIGAARAADDPASAEDRARSAAVALARTLLQPVVNGTGVLLHTNLGRAPVEWHQDAAYANVELDLDRGERGSRHAHAAALIARACGAESAIVVNNGAAAVLLALAALGSGRAVAVSRGELVEIGGGFRVPEVLAQSGCELVEVGTTNRTRLADYERVASEVALLLKVHQSNYRIVGFTEQVDADALARLGPPVVVDAGSGLLDADCPWLRSGPPPWLAGEPAVRQLLESGAGLVTFSGDKLLGGPQAGLIAGDAPLVSQCARHPLARALRPGGLVLAALQATALAYLRRDGEAIPFWRMATVPVEELRRRAAAVVAAAGRGRVVDSVATPGGGSVPGLSVPSAGVAVDGDVTAALRDHRRPVIGILRDGATVVDLRSVAPDDDATVAAALADASGR